MALSYEQREAACRAIYERGDFRTVLFKNKYGEPLVDVIALNKIGTKYIRGVYIYRDPDTGTLKPQTCWDLTKIPKENATVLLGQHWELVDQLLVWQRAMSAHREARKKAEREYEYEAREKMREEVDAKMKTWKEANPEPKYSLENYKPDGV